MGGNGALKAIMLYMSYPRSDGKMQGASINRSGTLEMLERYNYCSAESTGYGRGREA